MRPALIDPKYMSWKDVCLMEGQRKSLKNGRPCLMKGFMKRNIIGGILRTAFNANNCELIMVIVT